MWKQILRNSFELPEQLPSSLGIDKAEIEKVSRVYPMRVNPYYFGLIEDKNDPIYRQCIPDAAELEDLDGPEDPLAEEADSPVPGLVHRYPDRVLFLVSNECAMYCRFCTRKRKVGRQDSCYPRVTEDTISQGLRYIAEHEEVRDVLLSGGDPLLLSDERLDAILSRLRAFPHVEIIRIGSRVPVTLPQRVTPSLCRTLQRHHPLFMNTHFNHPREVTEESKRACVMLADHGIPMGNQSVLLHGVNDDPLVMRELYQKLLRIRVKPYYLFQADLTRGTKHFRTDVAKGLEIIEACAAGLPALPCPSTLSMHPTAAARYPCCLST